MVRGRYGRGWWYCGKRMAMVSVIVVRNGRGWYCGKRMAVGQWYDGMVGVRYKTKLKKVVKPYASICLLFLSFCLSLGGFPSTADEHAAKVQETLQTAAEAGDQ